MRRHLTPNLLVWLERHCPETALHSRRVAFYARLFGRDAAEQALLYDCGLLHDAGKLFLSCNILRKPGPLTMEERNEIEKHPLWGKMLLEKENVCPEIIEAAYYHHERITGCGYPQGLTEIPYIARVVAVADVWDALIGDRPYRKAFPVEKAREILLWEAETGNLDARLVGMFLSFSSTKKRVSAVQT